MIRQGETPAPRLGPGSGESWPTRTEAEEFVERTVEDVVLSRQAIRRYSDRPVPDGLLLKLFSLAQRAPSDWNLQPWRWLVLRRKRDRERLHAHAHGRSEVLGAPVVVLALANTREWERASEHLREEVEIGRYNSEEGERQLQMLLTGLRDKPERAREFAVRNTMLAIMSFILLAQAEGLGTGFIGTFDEDGLRSEFQIPDDWTMATILTLGYAAEEPPRSLRKPLGDVLHWDKIGGKRSPS